MIMRGSFCVASLAIGALAGMPSAQAATLLPNDLYELTSMSENWALGGINFNSAEPASLSDAQDILRDGADLSTDDDAYNGIYRWPTGAQEHLIFSFLNDRDVILDSLGFVSSRSFNSSTSIVLQYRLDGGDWITSEATTTGALGVAPTSVGEYSMSFGNVMADEFRILLPTDGNQISFHEVFITGIEVPSEVPVPGSLPLILSGILGLGLFARRRKPQA